MESECKGIVYTISKGDTLYNISRKYQVPLAWILRANPYIDVYNLQVGETICIPSAEEMNQPMRPNRPPQRPQMQRPPVQQPSASRPPMNQPQRPVSPGMPNPPSMNRPGMEPGEMECPTCMLVSYVVEDGDSVGSLLQRFGITLAELLENNALEDLKLTEGTVLKIMEDARD
ncbi:MAG: LysM peptidoglycan-binding domain-containing protein [Clostridiales bacterium]|nr:LysM peptidoglycan-binding domain-containing protein [Clostridiales bacterium]